MSAVFDILSSPLKSYITQTLQFYLSKYIKDVKLDGLGVFGRDIILNDLEIKRDVLRVLHLSISHMQMMFEKIGDIMK